MEGVYDVRLPETLHKLKPEDVANNATVSAETVKLLLAQLTSLLGQLPVINPPTFIPPQNISATEKDLHDLIQGTRNAVDATTNTPIGVDKNETCYYLVPSHPKK